MIWSHIYLSCEPPLFPVVFGDWRLMGDYLDRQSVRPFLLPVPDLCGIGDPVQRRWPLHRAGGRFLWTRSPGVLARTSFLAALFSWSHNRTPASWTCSGSARRVLSSDISGSTAFRRVSELLRKRLSVLWLLAGSDGSPSRVEPAALPALDLCAGLDGLDGSAGLPWGLARLLSGTGHARPRNDSSLLPYGQPGLSARANRRLVSRILAAD
jgi:hypothetical protein